MLFVQPVVVNDAAQRPVAAEVRVAERPVDQPEWTGPMLAQGPTDQRSPFGAGAPDKNDVTPPPSLVPPNRPSSEPTPADNGKSPFTDPMDKKIPPPARPDAGPPPSSENLDRADAVGPLAQNTETPGTTTTPGAAPTTTPGAGPSLTMPGAAPTTAAPGTPPTTATPGAAPTTTTPGLGGASGTTTTPGSVPDTTVTGTGGTSGTIVNPGQGLAPGATTAPGTTTTVPGGVSPPAQPQTGSSMASPAFPGTNSSSTFPGASSGASNTR